MRMTTKLLFLLTILFVFFKFGEPTNVMLSISGDKNFLFYTAALKAAELVGFVYDDANGGVAMTNCTSSVKDASFTLNTDCTVTSTAAIDTTAAVIASEVADFPATGAPSNIMVARPAAVPVVANDLGTLGTVATLVTVQGFPATSDIGSGAVAVQTSSSFLCNTLAATHSASFFTVDVNAGSAGFGKINNAESQQTKYPPVIKCVARVKSADDQTGANAGDAAGAYVVIVSDHASITARFHLLAVPSVVILHPSVTQATNKSTTVGYINGIDACPSSDNLTFTATTATPAQCKGGVTTTTALDSFPYITFAYNGTNHYLNVTGVNGTTTTTTTTCTSTSDSFAFNFKYSKISIGMLLIYLLKMLKSFSIQ